MLCYATLRYAMLCYATLRYAMQCDAMRLDEVSDELACLRGHVIGLSPVAHAAETGEVNEVESRHLV